MSHNGVSRGMVTRCSRNSFTVRVEREETGGATEFFECNIKGKILKEAKGFYNPLAPGDSVLVETDAGGAETGQIVSLEKRRNYFSRFNQKGQSPQLLAANIDAALCLTTITSPPFRPRFLDRVLLQADTANVEPVIVCNKIDLASDDIDAEERLEDFRRIGYRVFRVSALSGKGLEALRDFITGKCVVLIGQSGVGKSSLLNALHPGLNIKTAPVNEKYDRGNHTTVMAQMLELPDSEVSRNAAARVIDTPGIRRFVPDGITAAEIITHMKEFAPLAGLCTYGMSCSHRIEPGCKIMEAVHAGAIHEDRYESYLRIYDELNNNG